MCSVTIVGCVWYTIFFLANIGISADLLFEISSLFSVHQVVAVSKALSKVLRM